MQERLDTAAAISAWGAKGIEGARPRHFLPDWGAEEQLDGTPAAVPTRQSPEEMVGFMRRIQAKGTRKKRKT